MPSSHLPFFEGRQGCWWFSRDSADLEGLVWGEGRCDNPSGSRPNFFGDSTSPLTRGGKNVVRSERGASNPSGSRSNFFGRQHLTFDKGGKGDGAKQGKGVGGFRGIVRFCEGWMRNEGLLTEVSEKRKRYGKCDNPSKFAMLCTATKKIGYCAVPD